MQVLHLLSNVISLETYFYFFPTIFNKDQEDNVSIFCCQYWF